MSVREKGDGKESRQPSAISRQVVRLGVGVLAGPFSKREKGRTWHALLSTLGPRLAAKKRTGTWGRPKFLCPCFMFRFKGVLSNIRVGGDRGRRLEFGWWSVSRDR